MTIDPETPKWKLADHAVRFRGYYDEKDLPFKRGQVVVIPRGTPVQTTHPTRKNYVTKSKRTVVIHSFGAGMSFWIGHVSKDLVRSGCLTRREGPRLQALYGSDDPDVLVNHPDAVISGRAVFLPITNPTVMWAGSGGYWSKVDINLLLDANGISVTTLPGR